MGFLDRQPVSVGDSPHVGMHHRKLAEAGDRVSALNDRVQRSVPRAISEGLASVKRLVHEHNVAGVHGTLMELFHCPGEASVRDL